MTAFFGIVAIIVLGGLAFWVLGSIALRVLGALFIVMGLVDLAAGEFQPITGLFGLAVGLLMWLAGHWLYAYRHHGYAGPLVERIFFQVLPRRLDPTRGWGFPVHHAHTHHHHHHAPPAQPPAPPSTGSDGTARR